MKRPVILSAPPRVSNCTILPNEVYQLKLSPTALAIYSYLRRLADPETHQCWPSYANIADTLQCCKKTVGKYVSELCEAGLIDIEQTTVTTSSGEKRNGNLLYAHSEAECEEKLAALIVEMKAEIAAEREQMRESG